MAKEKTDYLEVVPFIEEKGFKVKAVWTGNTILPFDFDKNEYEIIERNGFKYMRVQCSCLRLELE